MPEFTADSLADQLRAVAVKVTRPRLRVLAILSKATAPLTHSELEERLAGDDEGLLDRVTLYRVLDSLVDCGLGQRIVDERGVYRFMLSSIQAAHAAHAHFHCQRCGGITCLEQMTSPVAALPVGFISRRVDIEVRGVCAQCSSLNSGAR